MLNVLRDPPRYLFFTGKGGVGKTSLACAAALALADSGKSVLLISTDPASNLDEMLGQKLSNHPKSIAGAPALRALNIDPAAAAEAYRARVIAQMGDAATETERANVREELSGACTTEIAAFDEFVGLLADESADYDHVIFDTAPTGHTLRLLSLPKAWTGFLEGNDRGASCLGPHSGLKMQEGRFRAALASLADSQRTVFVIVTRPEKSAIVEAARTSSELNALGLGNQCLIVNGVFHASSGEDRVARALERQGRQALAEIPESLAMLPRDEVPLRAFDMVGLQALRALLSARKEPEEAPADRPYPSVAPADLPGLGRLIDQIAAAGRGLIMVMGKGGVGKTTVAAACAVGLVERGYSVHLTTTDPAAHLAMTLEGGNLPGLRVDRIDPKAETNKYIEKIMATRGAKLDEQARALLREDLGSPCTEEVAVFHAFARTVSEARSSFVILDTAPTGHTVLLMDATGAYHRQIMRDFARHSTPGRIITPLMRLQDPLYTRVILVTLPEITPVSEAAALQEDLRRAKIEPFAWIINRSLLASGARDPLLRRRLIGERKQIERVERSLARNTFVVPWQATPPVGLLALKRLVA